jgi:SET domain
VSQSISDFGIRVVIKIIKIFFLSPCRLFLAMFCSKKCGDSVIHRYECNAPKEESFDKLLLQRMFYQAIEITGSLEELQKLMNRQTSNKTIMDFDLSDPADPMKDKNRILATTSLAEREPWSAEAYAKYESVTQQLQTDSEDERDFVRNYLVRCLKSMTVNFFHFFWSPKQPEGQGFALCSLAAYFAHSCDPNVEKIDVDNKFAFVVKKPIKSGEQLFMNYDRYSFLTHSLEQRQEYFTKIYTFQCACNACKDDYQQLANLRKIDESFSLTEVEDVTVEVAQEQYKKNCAYIKDNMHNYPCVEICSLMIQNYDLLHAIGNNLTF